MARRSQRLAWLTGFTGSAGMAIVLAERAALFVDGRYTLQAAAQVDGALYEHRHITDEPADAWLRSHLSADAALGYDPRLHSAHGRDRLACAVPGRWRAPRPMRGQSHRRGVGRPAAAAAWPHRPPPGALRGRRNWREAANNRRPAHREGCRRRGAERTRFDRLAAQRAGRRRRQQPPPPFLRHRSWRGRCRLVRGSPQAPARSPGSSWQCGARCRRQTRWQTCSMGLRRQARQC